MTSYVLLVAPSANRVYAHAAPMMTVAELDVLGETVLADRMTAASPVDIAGVPYVAFEGELDEDDLAYIANVSTALALFERDGGLLRPVTLRRLDVFDDDLLTILKYQGKTNEQLTKLLLNITVLASAARHRMLTDRLRVLDPLCGRGTTLNQALMYGWHAAGVDADEHDFEAYRAFLRRWLTDKRLKHRAESSKLRRDGRTLGRRFEAELATDKEAWAAGDTVTVTTALADTQDAPRIFRRGSFDVVVTDAPYGVQHGSRTAGSIRRDPLELLGEAVPGWAVLLRAGGALGIAVNTHTCPRAEALAVLADAGLEGVDTPAYRGFEHRVDQAITRDLVVAVKHRDPTSAAR